MEELHHDPDLSALEEMIVSYRWNDAYLDDEDDEEVFLFPTMPGDFRPAA